MNRLIVILILAFLPSWAWLQPAGAQTEVKNGKTYYVHVVEKGNTLYGLHTLYNVPVEDILSANEGLSTDLVIGQKVYIPKQGGAAVPADAPCHIVAAGETLYGISKKYKCSVQDLEKLNPGVEAGLSIGQKLILPGGTTEFVPDDPINVEEPRKYDISFADSIVMHTVLDHETMYSISKRYMISMDTIMAVNNLKSTKVKKGDVLKIPLKKVNYEVIEKDINSLYGNNNPNDSTSQPLIKQSYNIALMLPFMLDENEQEMTKTLNPGQERELFPTTKIAYAFYQGFMFAADTLKKAGFNVNIYVYDTKRDSNVIAKHMAKPEFSEMDLVVGPLFDNSVKYVTRMCKEKKIKVVLPFKSATQYLHKNPYVYNSVASNMTLMDGIVDYIVEKKAHYNILLLKPYSETDKALYDRARDRFNSKIKEKAGAMNVTIKEVDLGSSSGRELNSFINKDTVNMIIVPSNDIKFISGSLNRMNKVMNLNPYAKNLKIIAFGFEDWNNYDDLDIRHRNRLYQHYASYRFVDYNSKKGRAFIRAFRAKYGIDPNVFATQGFDVGLYFMSALQMYGANFESRLGGHRLEGVQNNFQFQPVAADGGRENKRVCIVMYNNFNLIRVN